MGVGLYTVTGHLRKYLAWKAMLVLLYLAPGSWWFSYLVCRFSTRRGHEVKFS